MREQGSHRVELPPRWQGRQVAGSVLSRCSYPLTSSARSTHLHTRCCMRITYTGGNITHDSVKSNVTFASVPFFPQIIWMEVDWSGRPRQGRPVWRRLGGGAQARSPSRVARQGRPLGRPIVFHDNHLKHTQTIVQTHPDMNQHCRRKSLRRARRRWSLSVRCVGCWHRSMQSMEVV